MQAYPCRRYKSSSNRRTTNLYLLWVYSHALRMHTDAHADSSIINDKSIHQHRCSWCQQIKQIYIFFLFFLTDRGTTLISGKQTKNAALLESLRGSAQQWSSKPLTGLLNSSHEASERELRSNLQDGGGRGCHRGFSTHQTGSKETETKKAEQVCETQQGPECGGWWTKSDEGQVKIKERQEKE